MLIEAPAGTLHRAIDLFDGLPMKFHERSFRFALKTGADGSVSPQSDYRPN
jgi:hypothetical protein